jgi:hypothetical protein
VIVRILGEGQLILPESALDELNKLDDVLQEAVSSGDEAEFRTAMDALLTRVRALGQPLDPAELTPSDFILPGSDSDLEEVRDLLSSDGLIPG